MKKIFALMLIVMMLSACSVSTTSTTTVSSSITADGTTTTNELTIENGVATSSSTTTSADDPTGLRNDWQTMFNAGCEGVSDAGNEVYFIYNTGNDSSLAAIMILDGESGKLVVYDFGDIIEEDDHLIINDIEGDSVIPFALDETPEEGMDIYFQNDDHAFLEYVTLDEIIDHMISIWEEQRESYTDPEKEQ